jgi:signal transduction histidine kinase
MLEERWGSTEIDYICIATDLLASLTSDLQSLESNNAALALAMVTAGHDLRQGLQVLATTLDLIARTDDTRRAADLVQRAKEMILRQAGELEHLVVQANCDRSLAVLTPQRFVVSSVLEKIHSDWQAEAAAKHLRFVVDQADYVVESDQRLLSAILNNIIGNAVRHTSNGRVSVDSTVDGPSLLLVVTDTGPGISDEVLRRSYGFKPRALGSNLGMGIGLSIARKTAEVLGHNFDIASTPKVGTCVRLRLPLACNSRVQGTEHGARHIG